jgi:hypothetical protein
VVLIPDRVGTDPGLGVWISKRRRHSGVITPPSHFGVLGHHRDVRTRINGGVLRLLELLEFSDDRCVG